jgi:predicted Fe-Mo cluster-binding NifX family protein
MAGPISDCGILIGGGMGMGAYENLRQLHIEPIITAEVDIEKALTAYLQGTLDNQLDRLH